MFSSKELRTREILGLTGDAPIAAWLALRGDPHVPASRFGVTSLRIFTPRLAIATWAGRRLLGRRLPVVNLVNRTPTPIEEGWSVRVTQVRDFRGRSLTYDSHNGTDFVVPPGTRVVAPAAGRVVAIRNEFNRGGLKVYIDHGGGLLTSSHHLARTLVSVGQRVGRGETVALSGYSGIDALASFPWVAPHVHFNTLLAGALVDPFARDDEVALWRGGNQPTAAPESDEPEEPDQSKPTPTAFDAERVKALIEDLQDAQRRAKLLAIEDPSLRAWAVVLEAVIYPTRFASLSATSLFDEAERRPVLDLPFSAADYDEIVFADDVGLR